MRLFPAFAAMFLAASPTLADVTQVEAEGDVMTVFKRLETAVAEAGATIFARVDHAGGAASIDMALADSQLLIFGNPKIGTPAMQDDPRAGLFLPLKMLVYADDEGQTWVAYEEIEEMFDDLEIDDDAEYIQTMEGVMARFAETAAGG